MFGLIVSDPACDAARRDALSRLLYALDLPLTAFTEEPASLFVGAMHRESFLRTASAALLQPGQPLPMAALLTHLSTAGPLPANVLRRYLFLQLSLLPYFRPGRAIAQDAGCFLVGSDLLVAPVSPEDTVDALLPPGTWTELNGICHARRLRCIRGYNEMPVLARENAVLPIGVQDRTTDHDDADRLTLHWFQPQIQAECRLADGTRYHLRHESGAFLVHADTDKPFHLIVHQDGQETLVR